MRPILFLSLAIAMLGKSAIAQTSAPPQTGAPPASSVEPRSPAPSNAPTEPPRPVAPVWQGAPTGGGQAAPGQSPSSIAPPYVAEPGAPSALPPPTDPALWRARSHRGFFLRMAIGGGYIGTTTQMDMDANSTQTQFKGKGSAFALELAIGGALSPGFILAGSYSVASVGNATLSEDTRAVRLPHDPQITLLMGMVDLYPNPKDGFHFGGGLGLATMHLRADENQTEDTSGSQTGVGIAPHVGYEWWIGNYWGIGALGRFFYARTKGDHPGYRETDASVGATLLFSATYN